MKHTVAYRDMAEYNDFLRAHAGSLVAAVGDCAVHRDDAGACLAEVLWPRDVIPDWDTWTATLRTLAALVSEPLSVARCVQRLSPYECLQPAFGNSLESLELVQSAAQFLMLPASIMQKVQDAVDAWRAVRADTVAVPLPSRIWPCALSYSGDDQAFGVIVDALATAPFDESNLLHWIVAGDEDGLVRMLLSEEKGKDCWRFEKFACAVAAGVGNLDMLRLWSAKSGVDLDDLCVWVAAENGHVHALECLADVDAAFGVAAYWAALHGKRPLPVLQWLLDHGCPWDGTVCTVAIDNCSDLSVLQWLLDHGCPRDEDTCAHAGAKGRLEALQCLPAAGCPWDERTWVCALEDGHPATARWALENGCPHVDGDFVGYTIALYGTCELLQWAHESGIVAALSLRMHEAAAEVGNWGVMLWLHANGCALRGDADAMNRIRYCLVWRSNNTIEALQWAHNVAGLELTPTMLWAAAERGFLTVLQWLHAKRDFTPAALTAAFVLAAGRGRVRVLRWLRDVGCPWNGDACALAAARGQLKALKWLRKAGCPWDRRTCTSAARHNQFDVLKWARGAGCPWDSYTCVNAAVVNNFAMLQWAHEQGCSLGRGLDICCAAAGHGNLEMLEWAWRHGCQWDERVTARAAAYPRVLAWARAHGCP